MIHLYVKTVLFPQISSNSCLYFRGFEIASLDVVVLKDTKKTVLSVVSVFLLTDIWYRKHLDESSHQSHAKRRGIWKNCRGLFVRFVNCLSYVVYLCSIFLISSFCFLIAIAKSVTGKQITELNWAYHF